MQKERKELMVAALDFVMNVVHSFLWNGQNFVVYAVKEDPNMTFQVTTVHRVLKILNLKKKKKKLYTCIKSLKFISLFFIDAIKKFLT